jgi:hypothetical protein
MLPVLCGLPSCIRGTGSASAEGVSNTPAELKPGGAYPASAASTPLLKHPTSTAGPPRYEAGQTPASQQHELCSLVLQGSTVLTSGGQEGNPAEAPADAAAVVSNPSLSRPSLLLPSSRTCVGCPSTAHPGTSATAAPGPAGSGTPCSTRSLASTFVLAFSDVGSTVDFAQLFGAPAGGGSSGTPTRCAVAPVNPASTAHNLPVQLSCIICAAVIWIKHV